MKLFDNFHLDNNRLYFCIVKENPLININETQTKKTSARAIENKIVTNILISKMSKINFINNYTNSDRK